MFETVGMARPTGAARRGVSLSVALALNFAILGVLWELRPPMPTPIEVEDALPVIFRELVRPMPVTMEPAAPAPPKARSNPSSRPTPTPTPTLEPSPSPVIPAPAVLDPGGLPGDGLVSSGEGEGEGEGGEGEGEGSGARAYHYTEVTVRRRVAPEFPEAARQLGLNEAKCRVRFVVDERGDPEEVNVTGCPEAFAPSAREAAWKWRFMPMRENGVAVKATFELSIIYRLK